MFDDQGKLIQAVNLKGDQHVEVGFERAHPLGPSGVLIVATNWHDNSNQSYSSQTLILGRSDGFAVIGVVRTFGDRFCRLGTTETATLQTRRPSGPMTQIEVEVRRTVQRYAANCGPSSGRSAYSW
jgi:hypothetical protein